MPIVTLSTGVEINSESVKSARFVEKGASLGRGFVGEPRDTAVEDELSLEMNDGFNGGIKGARAHEDAEALERAGVVVLRTRNKSK